MNDILVVDNDFIDKVAKSEQLELLRLEGKKIVITDGPMLKLITVGNSTIKNYDELKKGGDNLSIYDLFI